MVARTGLLLLALAACASTGFAQAPPPAPLPPAPPLSDGLRPLFSTVRVRTTNGGHLTGVVQRAAQDSLLIRRSRLLPATTHLPHADIDSVWVRRSAWKKGAVIGALAGTAFYTWTASRLDDNDVTAAHMMVPTTTGEAVVFGVVVGGSFGSVIGSRFRRWQLHYAAPASHR